MRSVKENPANVRAFALLGDIYHHREQYDRACQAYAEARHLRPDKRAFRLRLIDSGVRAHRLEAAAFELREMLEQEPREADLWAALGIVLAGTGHSLEARSAFDRAAELDSSGRGYSEGLAILRSDDAYSRLLVEFWPRIFDF
jgi:cytochrome c-type biogenesis protein CcmH/NrfG